MRGIRGNGFLRLVGALKLAVATVGFFAAPAATQTAEVTFDLKIEKGRVAQSMRLIRVKQGDAVRLRWSTDRPIVLHLHGYDIEIKVEPGKTARGVVVDFRPPGPLVEPPTEAAKTAP